MGGASPDELLKRSNNLPATSFTQVYEGSPAPAVYVPESNATQEHQASLEWQDRHPAFHDWPADLYEQHMKQLRKLDIDDEDPTQAQNQEAAQPPKSSRKAKSTRQKGRRMLNEIAPSPALSEVEQGISPAEWALAGATLALSATSVGAYAHAKNEEKKLLRRLREQQLQESRESGEGPLARASAQPRQTSADRAYESTLREREERLQQI